MKPIMDVIKNTKSHSSYWLGDYWSDEDISKSFAKADKKNHDLIKLAKTKRAITNFVRISTNKNIPVRYNSLGKSYTDGKSVVLSPTFQTPQDFDVACGLALHEAMHIVKSNFDYVSDIAVNTPRTLVKKANDKNIINWIENIKDVLNYVEDRRIDYENYKAAPGYRGYYDAMYDKYFNSPIIDAGLVSTEYRTETMESYMFRLINLHNKYTDLKALKGLNEIMKLMDFKNISRLTSTSDAWDLAVKIFEVIVDSIDADKQDAENTKPQDKKDGKGEKGEGGGSGSGDADGDDDGEAEELSDEEFDKILENGLESSDAGKGGKPIKLTPEQLEKLKEAIKSQSDFVKGEVEKDVLTSAEATELTTIEETGTEIENVAKDDFTGYQNKGVDVIVVNKLTDSLLNSDKFPMTSIYSGVATDLYTEAVQEGIRVGKRLGKKLQVRGEQRTTVFNRQRNGKIDKRMISTLGFGNENVFSYKETDSYSKANLHISIDASSSMDGDKWRNTMLNVTALCTAVDMISNLEIQVSFRTTQSNKPYVVLAYDSRVDSFSKVKKMFPKLEASGTTPEGLCFEAIMKDFLRAGTDFDSYFVNLSDGQPYFVADGVHYQGGKAAEHTRKMVKRIEAMGIKTLSYFVSDSGNKNSSDGQLFSTMYGAGARFIDVTSVSEITSTLNKMFLTKNKE